MEIQAKESRLVLGCIRSFAVLVFNVYSKAPHLGLPKPGNLQVQPAVLVVLMHSNRCVGAGLS